MEKILVFRPPFFCEYNTNLMEPQQSPHPPQPWAIIVRTVDGKSIRINLRSKDDDASVFPQLDAPRSVAALRDRVAEELSKPGVYPTGDLIDPSRIKILWRGRMLKDESPLTDYMGLCDGLNSEDPPILHVVLQMYQSSSSNGSTKPSKELVAKQKAAPKHTCQLRQISRHAVVCDVCALPGLNQTWCCKSCDYDECNGCYEARKELYDKVLPSDDNQEDDSDSDVPPPLIPLQPIQASSVAASATGGGPNVPSLRQLATTGSPGPTVPSTDDIRRWSVIGAPSSGSGRVSTPTSADEVVSSLTSAGSRTRAPQNTSSMPQSRKLPYVPAFNVLDFLNIRNNTPVPPSSVATTSTPSSVPLSALNSFITQANAIQEATRQLGTLHAQEHIYVNQIQASVANSEQVSASVHEGHHAIQHAMAHQREILNQISQQIATIASTLAAGRTTAGSTQPQSFSQMIQSLSNPMSSHSQMGPQSTQVQIHFGPGGPQIIPQPQTSNMPGMTASFTGFHCIHCRGFNGPCACAFRCPRQEGTTQCIAFGQAAQGSTPGPVPGTTTTGSATGSSSSSAGSSSTTPEMGFTFLPSSSTSSGSVTMPPGFASFLSSLHPGMFGMAGPAVASATPPSSVRSATAAVPSSQSNSAPNVSSIVPPQAPGFSPTSAPVTSSAQPSVGQLSSDSDGRLLRAEQMIEHLTGMVSHLTGSITEMQTMISTDQSRLHNLESQVADLRNTNAGAALPASTAAPSTSDSAAVTPAVRPRGSNVVLSDPVGLAISGYSSPGLLQLAILYRALVGGDRDFDATCDSAEVSTTSGFSAANATAIKDRIRALSSEERTGFDRILKGTSSKRQTAAVASPAATTTSSSAGSTSTATSTPTVLRSGFLSGREGL